MTPLSVICALWEGKLVAPWSRLKELWATPGLSQEKGNTIVLDFSDFSLMLLDLGELGEDTKIKLVSPLGLGGEEESL